ncbi:MAG TPA: serine/threonine-protein kinase [Terriglobales bacterium]|nr:serine/threonine-protein kinase [Terriglobales bacterium]
MPASSKSNSPAATARNASSAWIGQRVGAYEIVEQVGGGGMGEVYRAFRADDQFRKQVAIKLVRAGQGSEFIYRFKNERQILASLDHPNIARLLDGGTTESGLPYFVMELVEGEPIDRYCNARKLTIAERLELFLPVCSAVQYAHQRLIIHRDIKPGNILVTPEGLPKLLDFGIAKILTSDAPSLEAAPTVTLVHVLTPGYASPEQVKGGEITTASDVYSLGVVLYELLTGRHPYLRKDSGPQEIARAVCETEPERPSTAVRRTTVVGQRRTTNTAPNTPESFGDPGDKLSKKLRGDLDNIVLMALRKEPERRYGSVEQFSEDIRRHLGNLPVIARKDTPTYRMTKFVRRHRAAVIAAIVVAVTLLAGLGATLHEARIASRQRSRAEQRFSDVRELARSNLFELNDAIQNLPGSAPARHLVIQRALGYLDKLSQDASGDRDLMRETASGYERIAALQGNFSGPGIGDSKAALESYQKAWAIREALAKGSDDVNEAKAESKLLGGYIQTLMLTGRVGEASRIAQRGLSIADFELQKQPNDPQALLDSALARGRMSLVLAGSGSSGSTREIPEAIAQDREALKLLAQATRTRQDANVQSALLVANIRLADHLMKNRQFEDSLKVWNDMWNASNGLRGWPDVAKFRFYDHRSLLLDHMMDFQHAYDDSKMGLAAAQTLAEKDPNDLGYKINAAIMNGKLGMEEARLGKPVLGKAKLDDALAVGERLLADNPYETFYKNLLIVGYAYQAEILSLTGDQAGALKKLSESLVAASELAENDPQDMEAQLTAAKLHTSTGIVLARAGRYSDAQQELTTALARFDDFLRMRPRDPEGLHVSKLTRDDLAAVNECLTTHACKNISAMQLPNINN